MSTFDNTYFHELNAVGETYTIDVSGATPFSRYILTGSGNLSGAITITTSGTPKAGSKFLLDYQGNFTLTTGSLGILGTPINDILVNKKFNLEATYDGSGWITKIFVDWQGTSIIDANKIKASTITGNKLASSTVDISNITSNGNKQISLMEVSFESNEQCNNTIKMPTDYQINSIYYEVIKAIANTDAGTITPKINGSNITLDSAFSLAASTPINTTKTIVCTGANTGSAGDLVSFPAAKTTAGGKVRMTINWEKI